MSGDFLDSNILVYLFDERDVCKQAVSAQLVTDALVHGSAIISFQVVQETLNVLARGMVRPVLDDDLDDVLEQTLLPLWTVMPSPELYRRGLEVRQRYRFSFYDSLIVAAALEAGCTRVLSEDLQNGQEVDGLRIENPFAG